MIYFQKQVDSLLKYRDERIAVLEMRIQELERQRDAVVDRLLLQANIAPIVQVPKPEKQDEAAAVQADAISRMSVIGTDVLRKEEDTVVDAFEKVGT